MDQKMKVNYSELSLTQTKLNFILVVVFVLASLATHYFRLNTNPLNMNFILYKASAPNRANKVIKKSQPYPNHDLAMNLQLIFLNRANNLIIKYKVKLLISRRLSFILSENQR